MVSYIFLQARMSSRRLPGKVLFKLKNKTVLEQAVSNLKKIRLKKKIIVLTSKNKSDNKIVQHCKKKKILVFRGSLKNVYKRYLDAIKKFKNNFFIRINGDSPLIDYKIIEKAIRIFKSNKFDIVTNCQKRTFPKGQSVEIIKSDVFIKNYKFVKNKRYKEHIFLYYYSNSNKFKIFNIKKRVNSKNINQSIDTFEDYIKIKNYYKKK